MARHKAAQPGANAMVRRFSGKTFALAGRLDDEQRANAARLIRGDGGRVIEDVTATLAFLVVGPTSKTKPAPERLKAEQFNKAGASIRILSLLEFTELFLPDRALAEALLRAGPRGLERWKLLRGRLDAKLDLSDIDLRGTNLQGISLRGVNLDGADLSGADLTDASLPDALTGARLDGARLESARITKLVDCSLRGAEASGWLHEAVLERTDCTGANLHGASAFCLKAPGSIFEKANLSAANLYQADFRQLDFTGANLEEARLEQANFQGATLHGANLRKANLRQANLKSADLRNADLQEADLFEADLRDARIDGANFEGAHVGGANLGGLDCGTAHGLDPTKARGPGRAGPHVRKLVEAAGKTAAFGTGIDLDLPDGEEAHLGLEKHGNYLSGSRTLSGSRGEYVGKRVLAETLVALPRRWPQFTVRPESVTIWTREKPRGSPELKALALAAWCEACGVPVPTNEEIKTQARERKVRKTALYAQLLADLRGGRPGVRRWNERPLPVRRNAGSYREVDLAGTRLEGVNLRNLDFTGANFDRASLARADLTNGTFNKASFRGTRLARATLDATFGKADFEGATLRDGKLQHGRFRGANFKDADLSGADFSSGDLCGADLSTANLAGTRFWYTRFDHLTLFPSGFVLPEDTGLCWSGKGPDPRKRKEGVPATASQDPARADLRSRLGLTANPERLDKALAMLKAERFQLFSQVDDSALSGVVRSQSNPDLVYSCRLASDGSFSCCTQNLRPCGGLRGALCKHLLVLIVGLTKGGQLAAGRVGPWVEASRGKTPVLDRDAAGSLLLRYKGAEAGEIDWRPTETIPEDFYTV